MRKDGASLLVPVSGITSSDVDLSVANGDGSEGNSNLMEMKALMIAESVGGCITEERRKEVKQLTLEQLEEIFKAEARASLATAFLQAPDYFREGTGCILASLCGLAARFAEEMGLFATREDSWAHFITISEQILKETRPIFSLLEGAYEKGFLTTTRPNAKEIRRRLQELGLRFGDLGEEGEVEAG